MVLYEHLAIQVSTMLTDSGCGAARRGGGLGRLVGELGGGGEVASKLLVESVTRSRVIAQA